jgi:hypothetical protein
VSTQSYTLTNFVNNIYAELGEPTDYLPEKISSWVLDNSNIGKLNNLIGTCFSGVAYRNTRGTITGYGIEPSMKNDQLAIYKMLFDYEYFRGEARNVAKSSNTFGSDWTKLQEGDSLITKINKNDISKNFRMLSKDAKEDLDKAVKMYLKYNAIPDQIAGDDTEGISYYIIQEYQRTLN